MEIISDELSLKMATEIDNYLIDSLDKYKLEPLSLIAVMISRLTRLSEVVYDSEEEYLALLEHVIDKITNREFETEEVSNEILH